MATSELIEALQALAHERKIDEFYLIERLEQSLAKSYERILDLEWDARVTIDRQTGKIRADLICLADETFDEKKDMIIFDPLETWKKTKIHANTYTLRELLVPVFKGGECVYTSPSVMEIRDICTKEKDTLWDETKRLVNPHEVYVDLSDKLYKIKSELLEKMGREALEY